MTGRRVIFEVTVMCKIFPGVFPGLLLTLWDFHSSPLWRDAWQIWRDIYRSLFLSSFTSLQVGENYTKSTLVTMFHMIWILTIPCWLVLMWFLKCLRLYMFIAFALLWKKLENLRKAALTVCMKQTGRHFTLTCAVSPPAFSIEKSTLYQLRIFMHTVCVCPNWINWWYPAVFIILC